MGREVRRVPANWQHPKENGQFVPLLDGERLHERTREWDEEAALWVKGLRKDFGTGEPKPHGKDYSYEYWGGSRPNPVEYMPVWTPEEATHYMMYENTTEGTPISPAFATPEELARWLADTGASAFASQTASYESWLRVVKGGYAPSAVVSGGTVTSGVAALT